MNIGIIGAGNIGGNLGIAWAKRGHTIMYGARDPNSPKTQNAVTAIGADVQVGTLAEAAAFGEVIVIAVPWPGVREAIPALGDVSGKILIDTTNRITPSPEDGESAVGDIASLAHGAQVVKAFNTLGAEGLLDPIFSGHALSTFIVGDDAAAKAIVMGLATDIGLDAKDAGGMNNAVYVEGMGKLWVSMMRAGMGRDYAFVLLPR